MEDALTYRDRPYIQFPRVTVCENGMTVRVMEVSVPLLIFRGGPEPTSIADLNVIPKQTFS